MVRIMLWLHSNWNGMITKTTTTTKKKKKKKKGGGKTSPLTFHYNHLLWEKRKKINLTNLWTNSADDKTVDMFLNFFPRKQALREIRGKFCMSKTG